MPTIISQNALVAAAQAVAMVIWFDAIAQTMTGTSRMRIRVMIFGRFTRFFPAHLVLATRPPLA